MEQKNKIMEQKNKIMEQYQKVLVEFEKLFGVLTGETEENENIDNIDNRHDYASCLTSSNTDTLPSYLKYWFDKSYKIKINGKCQELKSTQMGIVNRLKAYCNENLIFNLNRQTGFTTLMMDYAANCVVFGCKTVAYFMNNVNNSNALTENFEEKYSDYGFHRVKNGTYDEFVHDIIPGKVIVTNINKRDFSDIDPDIVIFDNADFYDWSYEENIKFQQLVEGWSRDKSKQVIIGSVPNPNTDIFESYFKRLWLDIGDRFKKISVSADVDDDFKEYFEKYSDSRHYDFECCNAVKYFSEARKLYEKIKEL